MDFTKLLSVVALIFVVAGCAYSKTYVVDSYPSGALVSVNGEFAGKTPITRTSVCSTFSRPDVVVTKDGYHAVSSLEYEPHIGNIVLDAIVFWPILFLNAECPKDHYTIMLQK